jgi:hypothetical protein
MQAGRLPYVLDARGWKCLDEDGLQCARKLVKDEVLRKDLVDYQIDILGKSRRAVISSFRIMNRAERALRILQRHYILKNGLVPHNGSPAPADPGGHCHHGDRCRDMLKRSLLTDQYIPIYRVRSMMQVYKVPLVLTRQPDGGYTVTSPLLPELVTEGDTLAVGQLGLTWQDCEEA